MLFSIPTDNSYSFLIEYLYACEHLQTVSVYFLAFYIFLQLMRFRFRYNSKNPLKTC